jgi:hypothetical protein
MKTKDKTDSTVVFNKLAVRYVLSWDDRNSMTAEEQLERIKREILRYNLSYHQR